MSAEVAGIFVARLLSIIEQSEPREDAFSRHGQFCKVAENLGAEIFNAGGLAVLLQKDRRRTSATRRNCDRSGERDIHHQRGANAL